jgi:hypothetical protein
MKPFPKAEKFCSGSFSIKKVIGNGRIAPGSE